MYHNPNALHPVDPSDFPDISHMLKCDENGDEGFFQPHDVLNSTSFVISEKEPIHRRRHLQGVMRPEVIYE